MKQAEGKEDHAPWPRTLLAPSAQNQRKAIR